MKGLVIMAKKKGIIFMGRMPFVQSQRKISKVSYHYALGA